MRGYKISWNVLGEGRSDTVCGIKLQRAIVSVVSEFYCDIQVFAVAYDFSVVYLTVPAILSLNTYIFTTY